ncbi:MAG TPA: alpha/beta hydrolase [Prolixibacteraceae bacterium]|jgi:acetyl esterase/lipase|nr:alpha/beta hydrolase [Bacteroidales bacterium]HNQ37222.1 alpha/beta hydrolase [Prolixibacteraceae bacterium]HPJ78253.1 alpha/beta hydrolase [Prolixibacteraceae bacterium]
MVKLFPVFLFLSSLIFIDAPAAQERYLEESFDSVEVQTFTYASKDGLHLDLDVYLPYGDTAVTRPVVLYVHGGGFSGGQRNSPEIVAFCSRLARYGYAGVSMSYRLTRQGKPTGFGCDCPAADKLNTFQAAVEDLQDATAFLISHRETLGIDPQRIILAGSSAGAETVLNAAYQPPFCYGLDSGPVAYAGVISMAGAIPDTTRIFPDSAIPSLLFHGTCDNLVPYATASHHYCQPSQPGYLPLHGAYTISLKLAATGTPYWLHTTCGGAHEMASKPMWTYFGEIVEFCHRYVVREQWETRHTVVPGDQNRCSYQSFGFCED